MRHNILNTFNHLVIPQISILCKQFWTPPERIETALTEILQKYPQFSDYTRIIVSGETNNLSIYLLSQDDVILYTPFTRASHNIIVLQESPKVLIKGGGKLYLIENTENISNRLRLPKVVLINPSVKEVFPTPRLALCVGSLASYLRKYQKAAVYLIDMQVNWTIGGIREYIQSIQPNIIGISISFGQMALATFLLRNIFHYTNIAKKKPLVICGNVISSFEYKELLRNFPELIVCISEGELSIARLIDYVRGDINLEAVPGIAYRKGKETEKTTRIEVNMDDLPLPAMDTVEGIIKRDGALTMEISRGCSHSACSFCPRIHKSLRWKGMSAGKILKQMEYYRQIFDAFGIEKRVFMADEEFIGWMKTGLETKRIKNIMRGLIARHINVKFETNTRIDQIYNSKKNRQWHIRRMEMLALCKKAGLDRLLVGVESGSDSVLERFNKKIVSSDSIMAIRILTALGIRMRITFITFDPLMTFSELRDNVKFLERRDIYLREMSPSETTYSDLLDSIKDEAFAKLNSLNMPFYEYVSYMLVLLDVLMYCEYNTLIKEEEERRGKELVLNRETVDVGMARYKVKYLDETIGNIAVSCQTWIDKHFALDYCLKGIYKTAPNDEREMVFRVRSDYRKISFFLLKSLVWMFDEEHGMNLDGNIEDNEGLTRIRQGGKAEMEKIRDTMELFNYNMRMMVDDLKDAIKKGRIKDSNGVLQTTIREWEEKQDWLLINP